MLTASPLILAGDVGGTKVNLAFYRVAEGNLEELSSRKYRAQDYNSLAQVLEDFIRPDDFHRGRLAAACFGCPGPTHEGRVSLTNLSWQIDTARLAETLGGAQTYLINDLEANAYGIPELTADHVLELHTGKPEATGNRGLIAAGTGLGQAFLYLDRDGRYIPIASEGGHCDFAPWDERADALLGYLRRAIKGHVSYERVLSGLGLLNIYSFLREVEHLEEPRWLRDRLQSEDPNAVIGECAENENSILCVETMTMFASAYGAEAGNIALRMKTFGGMYLGGGIAPKILKTLQRGAFLDAFLHKGRLSSLLQDVPLRVITDERCALLGAAAYARLQVASSPVIHPPSEAQRFGEQGHLPHH